MPIESYKKEVIQNTIKQVAAEQPNALWRPKHVKTGPLPSQQKFAVVTLALNQAVTVGDHDALVAAIEAITGVQKALINFYGQTPDTASLPDNYDLYAYLRFAYEFVETSPSPSISPSIEFSPSFSPSPSPSP